MTPEARARRRDYQRQWKRRYRESHAAQGLCARCDQPAAPGFTECVYHVEQSRQHRGERALREEAGR